MGKAQAERIERLIEDRDAWRELYRRAGNVIDKHQEKLAEAHRRGALEALASVRGLIWDFVKRDLPLHGSLFDTYFDAIKRRYEEKTEE